MTSLLRWRQRVSLLRWRPRASLTEAAAASGQRTGNGGAASGRADLEMGLYDLAERYARALQEYCAAPDEAALSRAYELGRGAAAAGFGVLDLVAVHQDVLMEALRHVRAVRESMLVVERAGELFAECAAPFELTRRVYQDRAGAVAHSRKPRD